jgi:Flp pilus assembly protein TadD
MQRHRAKITICLLLIIVNLVVFWQVTGHDFVSYDDKEYITDNPKVQGGWTLNGIAWAFTTRHHHHWHPVTWLSHMTDCQLFDLDPGRHHLINLVLHILNTLLLFFVFNRLTGASLRSAMVAALFALHPLHVETVAWVADRKDVLSAFFWMLTMWTYVRYVERPSPGRYLQSLLLFILALMSKPMVVTLPLVLILLDYWPLGRLQFGTTREATSSQPTSGLTSGFAGQPVRRIFLEKVLFLFPVVISVMVTVVIMHARVTRSLKLAKLLPQIGLVKKSLVYYAVYIGKMIYPANLAVIYPPEKIIPDWQVGAAGLLLIGITFFALWKGRRYPYLAMGWLWYLITLLPVAGLLPIGPGKIADRYTYIPLIGLFVMIAWGIPDLLSQWRHRRKVLAILSGLVLLGAAICSWHQVRHWKNSITLFTHTVNVTSDNHIGHDNLGTALLRRGRLKEATNQFAEALRIKTHTDNVTYDNYIIHNNLGIALSRQGKLKEATSQFTEALRIKPDYVPARMNLGIALNNQGKTTEAIGHLNHALKIDPENADVYYNLGIIRQRQGKLEKALRHYTQAVRLNPDHADAHNNLGGMLLSQGRTEEAVTHFAAAVRLNPAHTIARRNLDKGLSLLKKSSEK